MSKESKESKEAVVGSPRGKLTDNPNIRPQDVHLRARTRLNKLFGGDHHNLIIPATENHAAWGLGAQPTDDSVESLFEESKGKITIVGMIIDDEKQLETDFIGDKEFYEHGERRADFIRNAWFDHGALDLGSSKSAEDILPKIQTVEDMKSLQEKVVAPFFGENKNDGMVYCHCFGGRSRSFVETMTFLFLKPRAFYDYDNWPRSAKKGISKDLEKCLKDNPSFSDLAEFVSLRRSVREYEKLGSQLAGLVGLMSLDRAANKVLGNRGKKRLLRDAQDIGKILKAPLDVAFRDEGDRKQQEENLVKAVEAYGKEGINLLAAMVVRPDEVTQRGSKTVDLSDIDAGLDEQVPDTYKEFEMHFEKLSASEQARFVILLKTLEGTPGVSKELGFLKGKSSGLAQIMVPLNDPGLTAKKVAELTAGDQVELLRSFGEVLSNKIAFESVGERIMSGDSVDAYNSGIQFGELNSIKREMVVAEEKANAPVQADWVSAKPSGSVTSGEPKIEIGKSRTMTQAPAIEEQQKEEAQEKASGPSNPAVWQSAGPTESVQKEEAHNIDEIFASDSKLDEALEDLKNGGNESATPIAQQAEQSNAGNSKVKIGAHRAQSWVKGSIEKVEEEKKEQKEQMPEKDRGPANQSM